MQGTAEQKLATILVVDDNEANRALAQGTLEDEGYRVALATCGAEALTAFEASSPDCVLLDVRMPDMDGFTVCERIRALPRGADTPVVFLTALRDVDTFDRALRAGGDDFLTKPVRPTELVIRVRAALKLRRVSVELREHYDLLKHQRDDLLRLQLQKERLMAFVVHDLKNPVNSMNLHAQLLARDKGLPDSAREAANQIRNEARVLNRMLLNLLDISKADEGRLEAVREDVDLPAMIAALVADLDLSARDHKVHLTTGDVAPRVSADPDLLRRILMNLVENAIRHSPPDGTVRVSAKAVDGAVELRIADAGPGVPAEMRERIFDPFVQLERTDCAPTRTGRGLGLTFCKLAAEAHGGRVWVEEGRPGSIFCVRVPG